MKEHGLNQIFLITIFLSISSCDNSNNRVGDQQKMVEAISTIADSNVLNRDQNINTENSSKEILAVNNNVPESDNAKKYPPTYHPGLDVDIIILKHVTPDLKKKIIHFWQLNTNKKVVSEPIVKSSDCRSFGFPVLYHAGKPDHKGITTSYYYRDPVLDVDTSCEEIDFSAHKNSGSDSFLVYHKNVPKYEPDLK